MTTYSASSKEIFDRIQADPRGASHYKRLKQISKISRDIREKVKEQAIPVRELAKRMGTSASQVQRMLDPENPANLTLDSLMRLAEALGEDLAISFGKKSGKGSVTYIQRGVFPERRDISRKIAEVSCTEKSTVCGVPTTSRSKLNGIENGESLKSFLGG